MGLKKDIYSAFADSMGEKITKPQRQAIKKQSDALGDAIITFLLEQEFRIVEMVSDIDIKSITTTQDLVGNITTGVKYINPSGTPTPLTGITGGVKLPALKLKSSFGAGGSLEVKGESKIKQNNWRADDTSKGMSKKSMVKLFKNEIKKD